MIGMMFRRTTVASLALAIVGVLLAATATPSQALGTANVQSDSTYVLLDSVYAGATYNLNTLVGGEAQDVTLQESSQDDAKLVDKNGVLNLKVYPESFGQSIFFWATMDGTSYYYEQPLYDRLDIPVKRKLGDGKVKITNPYEHPTTIKFWQDTFHRRPFLNFGLDAGANTIVVSKYRNPYVKVWVHFRGMKICVNDIYLRGVKLN